MGFSKKKAMKGADTAASGLEDQAKARTAAFRSSADDDMPSVRKSMSDTASPKSADTPKKQSFAEAFRAARKEKGAGSTFSWNGKSYSTNLAGEGSSGSKPKATQSASRSGTGSSSAKPAAPAAKPQESSASSRGSSLFADRPDYKAARERSGPGILSRIGSAVSSEVDRSRAVSAKQRAAEAARVAAIKASRQEPSGDKWAPGARPSGGRLLTQAGMKKGGKVKKYAKGGSIDGAAIRGKTRTKGAK